MLRKYWWLLIFSVGCGKEEPVPEKIIPFNVSFDFPSKLDINEDDDSEIEIPIRLDLSQKEAVSITYETIEQDVVEGSDYSVLSDNPLVIQSGDFSALVKLRINNNNIVQPEDRKIYLRIRSVSLKQAKIGIPTDVVITIREDDCNETVALAKNWFGDLTIQGESDFTEATGLEHKSGLCSGKVDIEGQFVGGNNPESKLTVSLIKDQIVPSEGEAIIERSKLFDFTNRYEIEATGSYDEVLKKMVLNYSFFDLENNANNFESTIIISVP